MDILLRLRLRDHCRRGWERLSEGKGLGNLLWVCVSKKCLTLYSKYHQHDCLNMGWTRTTIDISKWMGWDGEPTSPQPYTKSYGQLRNAESGQNGKEHTNGQPWKHTWITIIQTEQVIFRNICVYTYMCVTTVSEKKRSWIRKRERRGIWEGLGGDRGIKNCYNYNLNNKRENLSISGSILLCSSCGAGDRTLSTLDKCFTTRLHLQSSFWSDSWGDHSSLQGFLSTLLWVFLGLVFFWHSLFLFPSATVFLFPSTPMSVAKKPLLGAQRHPHPQFTNTAASSPSVSPL